MSDGSKFYIRFNNDTTPANIPTREFSGWESLQPTLKQEENRFGRDEMLDTQKGGVEYTPNIDETVFEKILQTDDEHGFEADVVQGIETKEGKILELEMDFVDSDTNQIDSFNTSLIRNGKLELLKGRMDTTLNLFSAVDLDGNPITPVPKRKTLFKSYPFVEYSKLEANANTIILGQGFQGTPALFNPIRNLIEYDIDDTLVGSIFPAIYDLDQDGNYDSGPPSFIPAEPNDFKVIVAQSNLTNLSAKVTLNVKVEWLGGGPVARPAWVRGYFVKGSGVIDDNIGIPANVFQFFDSGTLGPAAGSQPNVNVYNYSGSVNIDIGSVARGETVWFYFTHASQSVDTITRSTFTSASLELTAAANTYNTVVPTLRLYDVIKYWVKSTTGMDIDANRFFQGGEFYPLMMLNGNLLRLRDNQPFNITGSDILKVLNQFKADYQLTPDGEVFFGIFEDFYQDVEIGFLKQRQEDGFRLAYNPRFTANGFTMKFASFESQRENSQPNTSDEIHGQYEGSFPNKKADNKHAVEIGWTMSARTLERNRRAAIEETSKTATSDDDTLFGLDTVSPPSNTNAFTFSERAYLQHYYDPVANQLHLKNDGTFSWISLGITINTPFSINTMPNMQPNGGTYNVASVSHGELVINPIGSPADTDNDGYSFTLFTYLVNTNSIDAVSHTMTGSTGIENSDKYPNQRYSLGQTRLKYHDRYLATINLYHKDKQMRTSLYKNNPNAVILGNREGGAVSPIYPDGGVSLSQPILTPRLYKNITFSGDEYTLSTWIEISENIQNLRGFIRFIDNKGHVHKFYPKSASWSNEDDMLMFAEGEQKYEPAIINIFKDANGIYHIGSYQTTELKYKAVGLSYRLMDRENELLYNPIFWNRIAINGNLADTQNQLEEWLILLS